MKTFEVYCIFIAYAVEMLRPITELYYIRLDAQVDMLMSGVSLDELRLLDSEDA